MEKHIALALGKKIENYLHKQGFKVHMTRTNDQFVSLTDRTYQTNKLNNVIGFISVHANAAGQSRISGIETFSVDESVFKKDLVVMDHDDEKIFDRYKKHLSDKSKKLAEAVHHSLLSAGKELDFPIIDRKIKPNPAQVLFVEAPAILVEFGFLSNPEESLLLQRDDYQDLLARKTAEGFVHFDKQVLHPGMTNVIL